MAGGLRDLPGSVIMNGRSFGKPSTDWEIQRFVQHDMSDDQSGTANRNCQPALALR